MRTFRFVLSVLSVSCGGALVDGGVSDAGVDGSRSDAPFPSDALTFQCPSVCPVEGNDLSTCDPSYHPKHVCRCPARITDGGIPETCAGTSGNGVDLCGK